MPVMTWHGGPRDGEEVYLPKNWNGNPILVMYGSKQSPESRYVIPRLDQYGHWVLPFYEGFRHPTEETR